MLSPALQFIFAIVTVGAVGDYFLARYATQGALWQLGIGYAAYGGLLAFFIQSIRTMGLAWSNASWDGWSNLATGLVAVVALGERPSQTEWLGMGLIAAGIFLLGTNGTKQMAGKVK